MHPKALLVTAPAKVNLYLAVGDPRADGYHDVETVLQAISLSDRVVIEPAEEISLHSDVDLGIPAEENLAFRAATELGRESGVDAGARITLHKAIPAGAGLGGGSSDAAATLVGLSVLWGVGDRVVLEDLAGDLGADVPFFLHGGAAHLGGRGDVLMRRGPTPKLELALIKPPVQIPTSHAYRAFDKLGHVDSPGVDALSDALSTGNPRKIAAAVHNNMTDASVGLEGSISEAIALGRSHEGVFGAAMAGSGSAVFCICEDEAVADSVVKDARARGWWAESAHSVGHGVRVHSAEEAM